DLHTSTEATRKTRDDSSEHINGKDPHRPAILPVDHRCRDLELQKVILERAAIAVAKIREEADEGTTFP
ncbi:hypothetical protein Tco_1115321, partial [Tanacetum coccineum]